MRAIACFLLIALSLTLNACGSSMRRHNETLNRKIVSQNFESAANFVERSQNRYGSKNEMLFYLNAGLMRHLAGDYSLSNNHFERAKAVFDENLTRSISAGTAALAVSELARPYFGTDYDRAHINFFCALNFMRLGKPESAAVEARQLDVFFRTLNTTPRTNRFYNDDPFIRYFMGIVYESAGLINDAFISYRMALNGYRRQNVVAVPPSLPVALARTMRAMRLSQELAALTREFPHVAEPQIERDSEIIIIGYNGFIPRKLDTLISLSLGDAWVYVTHANLDTADEADFHRAKSAAIGALANDTITVALPRIQRVPNRINSFSARLGSEEVNSVLVSNLAIIRERSFSEDLPRIYARTVARAAMQYVLRRTASRTVEHHTGSQTVGFITNRALNVVSALTATSDTRGWDTLPETILMARIPAYEGRHEIVVHFRGKGGDIVQTRRVEVNVEKGRKAFVILRSFA